LVLYETKEEEKSGDIKVFLEFHSSYWVPGDFSGIEELLFIGLSLSSIKPKICKIYSGLL